jgi:hypothetical protein
MGERLHPIVSVLLALSSGVCALGCATTKACHPPPSSNVRALDIVPAGERTKLYAASGLKPVKRDLAPETCEGVCGAGAIRCEAELTTEGPEGRPTAMTGKVFCHFRAEETCVEHHGGGFDPFGLSSCPFGCGRGPVARRARRADPFANYVMGVAWMESVSVGAFAQLDVDVAEHAPELRPRVARAVRDEQRHARAARSLARALGVRPARAPQSPRLRRSLDEAALENAVEGCVRETFGAVVACVQAERAEDPALRRFFRSIARDELAHAALSWDLHRALMSRASVATRRRVAAAQRRALDELLPLPTTIRARIGAPTPSEHRAMVHAMAASLPFGAV